jgi:hypothetical protein
MSAGSVRLQKAAEDMAGESFDRNVDRLTELADGDLDAVHDAIWSVRSRKATAGSPEHIAFTLLAAAWRRIADARRRSFGAAR